MGTIVACDTVSPLRGFYIGGYIPTGVDTPAYSVSPFGLYPSSWFDSLIAATELQSPFILHILRKEGLALKGR